jgi:hypothetical protein
MVWKADLSASRGGAQVPYLNVARILIEGEQNGLARLSDNFWRDISGRDGR